MSGGVEPLVVAVAIGLLIGFERERHAWVEHEESPPMGTRTFALIGLGGALAGSLSAAVVAVGLVAVGALVVVGYWRTSTQHRGTTSEMAAVVTYLLGAYCQIDVAMAAGIGVAVALLLEQKTRVHRLLREVITDVEVDDALRYFAMALIVLPLLPDRAIDRWDVVNPNQVWRLVVVLAGIGWVGYVGTRVLGPRRGMVVSGVASGFVSAAATTAVLGRTARSTPEMFRPALAGALAASIATCVQAVAIVAVVDAPTGQALLLPMAAAAVALAVQVWLLSRGHEQVEVPTDPAGPARRPLQLRASLLIAAIITVTLLVSKVLLEQLGSAAAVLTAAVAGLADAHGAALGVATLADADAISGHTALVAVGVALATNTVVKVVLAHAAGGRRFGAAFTAGIAVPTVAAVAGFVVMLGRV